MELHAGPIDDVQRYLYHEGTNAYAYRFMGAHPMTQDGTAGYRFAVWAPNAAEVCVVGDFNAWNPYAAPLTCDDGGIWTGFFPVPEFTTYKYAIHTRHGNWLLKADPFAFHAETRPHTASKTFDIEGYEWHDDAWMSARAGLDPYHAPLNIYELHLGSWRRNEKGKFWDYRHLALELAAYVREMGYTHVQLLPVMEHPLDMSWGYQVTGYFAPTSRFGTPRDFMAFVDTLHQAGIGVLLDWVPAHFPRDAHGLRRFDGTALYEHEDPRRGDHPQWGTHIFNYGRTEVQSFLLSGAVYWLDMYHIDGLRVDAVSSMLYLDYCRDPGTWLPNAYGGRENLDAIALIRRINELCYRDYPGLILCAEEATAYPMVTKPTYLGGLGFGFKWNMGWMNDMLKYMKTDPIYRKWKHSLLTFSLFYAFSENYILPLSHDEMVHGKQSLLDRMPGDYWQMFANLRAFYGYTMAHPGKKLLFMGSEFAQFIEWKYDDALDWHLLLYDMHRMMQTYVKDLNRFYREHPPLYEVDDDWSGFTWLNANDADHSIASFVRYDRKGEALVAICNFTPVFWPSYRFGLPNAGTLSELLNSDDPAYGGSGQRNAGPVTAEHIAWDGHPWSAEVTVPPLSAVIYRYAYRAERPEPTILRGARIVDSARLRTRFIFPLSRSTQRKCTKRNISRSKPARMGGNGTV